MDKSKLTPYQLDNILEFMECWVCERCEKWLKFSTKKCKCQIKKKK